MRVDHFEKEYLRSGINLLRELKPIPTIFGEQVLKSTPVSQLPSLTAWRKPPKLRLSATREVNELENGEKISSFDQVNESNVLVNFYFKGLEAMYCIIEYFTKRVNTFRIDSCR